MGTSSQTNIATGPLLHAARESGPLTPSLSLPTMLGTTKLLDGGKVYVCADFFYPAEHICDICVLILFYAEPRSERAKRASSTAAASYYSNTRYI